MFFFSSSKTWCQKYGETLRIIDLHVDGKLLSVIHIMMHQRMLPKSSKLTAEKKEPSMNGNRERGAQLRNGIFHLA